MNTMMKLGAGLLGFGLVIAIMGALVIRSNAPTLDAAKPATSAATAANPPAVVTTPTPTTAQTSAPASTPSKPEAASAKK